MKKIVVGITKGIDVMARSKWGLFGDSIFYVPI